MLSKLKGNEHWTKKGDVNLFMWEKPSTAPDRGRARFSSCTARPWRPVPRSISRCLAALTRRSWIGLPHADMTPGAATWKGTDVRTKTVRSFAISQTARMIFPLSPDYIMKTRNPGPFWFTAFRQAALRAAAFAERHPDRVKRIASRRLRVDGRGEPHP